MLVPLFGLQLLLTIYRPEVDTVHVARHYEYITMAVTNSQVNQNMLILRLSHSLWLLCLLPV